MGANMKEETIAMVAVDLATRAVGAESKTTMGEIAEAAVSLVQTAAASGDLGFLHASYLRDPETGEFGTFETGNHVLGETDWMEYQDRLHAEIRRRDYPDHVTDRLVNRAIPPRFR